MLELERAERVTRLPADGGSREGRLIAMRSSLARVALCFGTYPPEHNGGSDFLANLGRALVDEGLEVLVLTSPSHGAPEQEEVQSGLRVARVVEDWRALTAAGR